MSSLGVKKRNRKAGLSPAEAPGRTAPQALFAAGASMLAYLAIFFSLHALGITPHAIFALLPVVVIAWCYGCVAGLVAGLLSAPANIALYELLGVDWYEFMTAKGALYIGTAATMLIGGVIGRLHDLSLRISAELEQRQRLAQELEEHRSLLEERVQSKTAALSSANLQLQAQYGQLAASERALHESEARYRSVVETASDAIVVTDADTNIVSWNKAAENIFGYSRQEMLGRSLLEIAPEGRRELHAKMLERLRPVADQPVLWTQAEGFAVRSDKTRFPCELSISQWTCENETYFTHVFRDISARQKIEKSMLQSEKMRALGEMAGGVAHDFNNVLAAVLGRAQLLRKTLQDQGHIEPDELLKGLAVIEQAAQDGAETVRRIREFSRGSDDAAAPGTVDLGEVIDGALEFTRVRWKSAAESRGLRYEVTCVAPESPVFVSGIASALREVFINLIHNALDAMPGGGSITITTHADDKTAAVTVADTGQGIAPELQERIFDPFFTTKGPQSTGLGTSVSLGIVTRHHGTITLESAEAAGSAFTVTLPVTKRAAAAGQPHATGVPSPPTSVLIVEDEAEIRSLLQDVIENIGHRAQGVEDGEAALALFRASQFDMVFTDLGMPGMSGWQVAQAIKQADATIPVALITGWEIGADSDELQSKGVDFVLHKPFKVDQIVKVIDAARNMKRPASKPRSTAGMFT